MNCVNKKSKEFKKLTADYGVSENTMELLIHQYWAEKGSEEEFPTRAYLDARLGFSPYEEHINSVIKVWDKFFSHPMVFNKRTSAYKAKYKALKIFPQKAVSLSLNSKGQYVLVVRKPVKDLKTTLKDMASKGSFSDKTLNLGIDGNKAFSMEKMRSLFNMFNTDRTSMALADKVFKIAENLNINVRFANMDNDNLGKYVPNDGVYLNRDFFTSVDNNERKANVILHEVIHAVSDYALSNVINNQHKSQALADFKDEITMIYGRVRHDKAIEGERGAISAKEFVAELSNPVFRAKLKEIGKEQSIWQKIIVAFKRLLGIHPSSDYYTRSMNALENALEAFDRDTYMEYNGILKELRKAQGDTSHKLSAQANEFISSLPEGEAKDITALLNREVSDYMYAANTNDKAITSERMDNKYFTFDDGVQVKVPFMPNEQQAKALNMMDKFIRSGETSMTLSGYAGTGKTSIMQMLQAKERREGVDMIFTATTNKAVAVLKKKVGNAMTLNKAFGINVEVDSSKKYDAKNLINNVRDENKIHFGSVVVIDEASMINEQNYQILNDIARDMGAKIIYVGDSAQLAPVNETRISKVFRDNEGRTVTELTKVERTDDNAILKEATDVRNGQGLSGVSSFNSEGKGVAYVKPQQKKEIGDIVRHFAPELTKDPDSFKIIAYTNAKVAAYNEAMRKTLGYTGNVPRVGEPIMGYVNYGYDHGQYKFINSESYKVVSVSPEVKMAFALNGKTYETTGNRISIEDPNGKVDTFNFIDVKGNTNNRRVALMLGKLVVGLWERYRRARSPREKRDILSDINSINKFLFVNDNIMEGNRTIVSKVWDFGYAMTAHKSQGSTFKNVLIDDVDIQKARRDESEGIVDLDIPMDEYDTVNPDDMIPVGDVKVDDVHDMNGATEINSVPFSLDEQPSNTAMIKSNDGTVNLVQQLEYVAISRATDTATIISDDVKVPGSPLHPNKNQSTDTTQPNMPNEHTEPTVTQQLVDHLKSIPGIKVFGRNAMEEFLRTHDVKKLQQYVDKHDLPKGELATLSSALMTKYGNKTSYGNVIQTANYEYTVNYKGAGEFDIIEYHQIDNNLKNNYNGRERKGFPESPNRWTTRNEITKRKYNSGSYHVENRKTNGDNAGLDISALQGKPNQTSNNAGSSQHQGWSEIKRDSATGRISFVDGDGRTVNTLEGGKEIEAFTTYQGEVYGFVDKDGNIYLDETKISPEHPIHEYTHLWDRIVQKHNPKLWQRGVELMKQTSMWETIANDERYGKQWQSMNLSKEKIESLIASEVHARFTGKGGELLLDNMAKNKGQANIIGKLKQWILDVWKDLKATFGSWSKEDLDKLTLKDFNHMPVRDFVNSVKLKEINSNKDFSVPNTVPASYDGFITPSKDTIFVFGSNPEGRHDAGAAKVAMQQFSAVYGVGEGLTGNAYALPTKDLQVEFTPDREDYSTQPLKENVKDIYFDVEKGTVEHPVSLIIKKIKDGKVTYAEEQWITDKDGFRDKVEKPDTEKTVTEAEFREITGRDKLSFTYSNSYGFAEVLYTGNKTSDGHAIYSINISIPDEKNQGKGIGSKMYEDIIDKLAEQGDYLTPGLVANTNHKWESLQKQGRIKKVTLKNGESVFIAIPKNKPSQNRDYSLRSISEKTITENIRRMYNIAKQNPSKKFKVAYTNGLDKKSLNGYTGAEMIKMFKNAGPIPSNVIFNKNWTEHWNEVESNIENNKQLLNNGTEEYKTTDEFRRVQEASRKMLEGGLSKYNTGVQELDDEHRGRIGGLLKRLLDSQGNGAGIPVRINVTHQNKDGRIGSFTLKEVNGNLFHDIFEVTRAYLRNGELVDLHDDYSDCKCFVTDDGLCGFAIEPDGNLVSVFSLSPTTNKGFLYAIKDFVRQEGATHLDAYASPNQPLQKIYAKTLGFHTASTMDYNMDYDHDDIAKNHGNPQVVFMVDHEVAEPKHFDKDSYDAAQQYQLDQLKPNRENMSLSSQSQQPNEPNKPMEPTPLTEPIKTAQPIKVSLPGYEHYDRQVKNGEQKGIEVDAEWKIPLLKELDSRIYNPNKKYYHIEYDKTKFKERLVNEECINKINVLLRRVHSQEEWDNLKLRDKLIKEEYEQNQYDKLAKQIDRLNNPMDADGSKLFETPLTSSEIKHAVEMAMDYASDIITRLQTEGESYAQEIAPGFKTKEGFDFKTATRQEVIEAIGLSNIFNKVHEWFDYTNDWYDSDEALDDAGDKANFLYDNWDAVMWMGAPFFNFNEGFGFKEQIGGPVERTYEDNQLPHDETFNKDNDEDELVEMYGEGREHYLVDSRTIDTVDSMSTLVKRALHDCYQLDEDGNPKINNMWGLKERVNVKDASLSILSWTQGAVTYEDMLMKISQKANLKKNNWVNQLLVKLNDNSGRYSDLQSQFFSTFCKHRTDYTVAINNDGKVASIPANRNPVLKQVMDTAKARFNADETPLFNSKRINFSLLGNKDSITDKYVFNLHKALHELEDLDKSLDIRVNYQRKRKAISEEQVKDASDILSKAMQAMGFNFIGEEIADILDESSLHNMVTALRTIVKTLDLSYNYMVNHPNEEYEIAPFNYASETGLVSAMRKFIKPITDSLEEVTQNTVYDNGKLYQAYTIPSFLSKLFQKFSIQDEEKFNDFIANEYGKSEFFSMGHEFDRNLLRERYHWRLPWLDMMANDKSYRQYFDHRVNLSYNGKGYMRNMNDLEYAMSVLSQYWSMSSDMKDYTKAYFRMPMQSNKPTEDYIGFVADKDKKTYKKDIVEGTPDKLGLYHMFLTELSRIQTVRMRNKVKGNKSFIKNFDTNGRNFCFFKFLNPYLNGLTDSDRHNGYGTNLLAPKEIYDEDGNVVENHDDSKFASLLQKKIKGEEALTSQEELEFDELAKKAIYNYLQDRFNGILDTWQENGLIKAARNITNIAESHVSLDNSFDENKQKEQFQEREKQIDDYIRGQLENFLWNDYFATKNILMLTVGDTAFYKDEEDLQKRLAQLHAPGLRGRVSAVDYDGKPVSDGKYRTVILKDFDKVKSNVIDNITEVFDRKIAQAPSNMKAQWEALKEDVLRAYSEINVADAEGYVSPTSYRKKAIMFGKWSRDAEKVYQKIRNGESVDFTEIKQAFQPLKPFVYSHLYKTMEVGNAPITNMYCPFQAKNSEYLLVMADVLLRNEETSRPNLLKAIFDVMEDSAFDGRQRDDKGNISINGTYNGKGIDTIQFESAIKSSLQGAVDIAQYADNLKEGEKKAKDELHKAIYKAGTQGYDSSAYNTDVSVQELPFEDYCLQQDVPDHFKDHEQAHGSQTRMIIPSDLEEYYDENKSHDDPDNIVKYEYDEWQETEKGKWEKVHVSKTAREIKEEYENVIHENIMTSLESLSQELHLNASSRVERNLALSKILQRELHSSPRYGIDLIQACTIDKVTGEFRIPKGDPIQCKRIEQLINSIIKNRVNKQLIPGGPIVQVSNFGTSRQLQIRFNDKKGKLLPTRKEYDLSKHKGKSYEDFCKENQGGIAYFEVFAPAWTEDLYRNFTDENGAINVEALDAIDPDLLKLITYRIPTEDKCSIAPCKIVGFLPKEAGSTIMLPYELTSQDGSDFDIDKRYVMRKALDLVVDYKKVADWLYKDCVDGKNISDEDSERLHKNIDTFIRVLRSDHSYTARYIPGGKTLSDKYDKLCAKKDEWQKVYSTAIPKGRNLRNNKIIDLSWSVLTNPATADKVLKPEGFDEQKKVGYMIAAYRNNPGISWDELEAIANGKDGIKHLKSLSYVEKDLAFFDTQLQFYKQNAAAASLIGVFAVNKIAHSTLEGDGIYLEVPKGTRAFTIGHKVFMNGNMELDPRFDTDGNNVGSTLGSLVGASADAVKDPILNLMNINMNTANILNALLRLGMSFKEAAMFLSQSVITKALAKCDKENLGGYSSIGTVIDGMIKDMDNKNHYTSDSNITTEEISPDELVEGLLDGDHEAIDYKVLIAFQRILGIAEQLRKPTLVTRFNSIAGAVGPLVIDNLMTEAKLSDFNGSDGSTGFTYKDKEGKWQPATFQTILDKHPILEGFHGTYDLANTLFNDTPAGSAGFRNVLNAFGLARNRIMRNRQLLDSLVNFYTSFLLIDNGLIDSRTLAYYIKKFPLEFNRIKESGKYKGNMLVDSISLGENKKSSYPFLQVNITGLDTVGKEKLSSAWIDLYNADKSLALKLFAYNFFKGGLTFSPKTFISLLPNYIKERISKKLDNGNEVSYVGTFRNLKLGNASPSTVVDQFIRNNWDDNGLVPYVKMSGEMHLEGNTLSVVSDEDKARCNGNAYIKSKIGKNTMLFRYDKENSNDTVMTYKAIQPLGNNGEYIEMSSNDIVKPMTPVEYIDNSDKQTTLSNGNLAEDSTNSLTQEESQEDNSKEDSNAGMSLIDMFMAYDSKYDKEKANAIINHYKNNIKEYGRLTLGQYGLLRGVFEKQGLKLNAREALEKFKEMC